MFSFLSRKSKGNRAVEAVHFVGKCSVDAEYIHIGDDENYIIELNDYVDALHEGLLQKDLYNKAPLTQTSYYFCDFNKLKNELLVGRMGTIKDKSDRNSVFVFSRKVTDKTILKYPLFAPSLYHDFFNNSDDLVESDLKESTLGHFKKAVKEQCLSSLYKDNKEVLNSAMDSLYSVNIQTYFDSLKSSSLSITLTQLMSSWLSWSENTRELESKHEVLPLLIELPLDNYLHHYVSFVCQLIEPIFDELASYRIFWWRDAELLAARCLIVPFEQNPKADLILFDKDKIQSLNCLNYQSSQDTGSLNATTLFDALQVIRAY